METDYSSFFCVVCRKTTANVNHETKKVGDDDDE